MFKSNQQVLVALVYLSLCLVCLVEPSAGAESPFAQCPKNILKDFEIRKACSMQLSIGEASPELHECACAIAVQEVNRLSLVDFEVRNLYDVYKYFRITEDPDKSEETLRGYMGRDLDWLKRFHANEIGGGVEARKSDLSRFYGKLIDYLSNYDQRGSSSVTYTSQAGLVDGSKSMEKRKQMARAATISACKRLTKPIDTHSSTFSKVLSANANLANQLVEDFPNLKTLLLVKAFCDFAAKVDFAY